MFNKKGEKNDSESVVCFRSLCPLVTIALVASSLAADSCQPVFDAITKIVTTPSHSYSTSVVNGKARSTEIIYVQGKTYMSRERQVVADPHDPR
ncbi:MAG TPA: hypothetical protein VI386_04535 [Candidatus Sulfotelmatobacter sp.]